MIYSVTLTYTRPADEVKRYLDSHKAWLIANVQHGRIILAGPLEPGTGGLVLAACTDVEELKAMMEQDPFIIRKVAEYHFSACAPALASAGFPEKWAPGAKFI